MDVLTNHRTESAYYKQLKLAQGACKAIEVVLNRRAHFSGFRSEVFVFVLGGAPTGKAYEVQDAFRFVMGEDVNPITRLEVAVRFYLDGGVLLLAADDNSILTNEQVEALDAVHRSNGCDARILFDLWTCKHDAEAPLRL